MFKSHDLSVPFMTTRMVFLGGYLGAGKTTLAYHLARALNKQNLSVSCVMNDQGNVLVDTQFMKSAGVDVREVTGACFCTKFDEFVKHARSLVNIGHLDVIIAEPIGTSTSLLASVVNPLKSIYGDEFSVAPLFVVMDSYRLLADMNNSAEPDSVSMNLISMQQLHEAEVIVLSKQDLLKPEERVMVKRQMQKWFPDAQIIEFTAKDEANLGLLVEIIQSNMMTNKEAPKVDQRAFAGEKATLGWYSSNLRISTNDGKLDVYDLITSIMKDISLEFEPENIAHVKVLISSPSLSVKISLVEGSMQVDGVKGGRFMIGEGDLVLNARVIASPYRLRNGIEAVVEDNLKKANTEIIKLDTSCFVPRIDVPQYSMVRQ